MKTTTFILMILSLFVLQISYSQDYKKIVDQNVVFLYLNDFKRPEIKKPPPNFEIIPEFRDCLYLFYLNNQDDDFVKRPSLKLFYSGSDKISKIDKSNPIVFRIHKSFLKKNKNIIIDLDFIKKIGPSKFLDLLRNIKTIFIIDIDDTIKKNILIKEVRVIKESMQ